MTPVEQARAAVRSLFQAYGRARDADERESVAREMARLMPNGNATIAELAAAALGTARDA